MIERDVGRKAAIQGFTGGRTGEPTGTTLRMHARTRDKRTVETGNQCHLITHCTQGLKCGCERQWVEKLEDLESAVKKFVSAIPKSVGVLLTADHGIVDVAQYRQIYLDQLDLPNLVSVGGDPRVLYLYFNTEVIATEKAAVQEFVGKRAYVAEAQELIEAGWFGDVEPYARTRMPELFVIALGETALYHRNFAKAKSLQMVGQHGSISPDELNVPLLRFAGFAKK